MNDRDTRAEWLSGAGCGCSLLALAVGTLATIAGLVGSFAIGMLSLALAEVLVRPIAGAFIVLQLVTIGVGVATLIAARRTRRSRATLMAVASIALGAAGLAAAVGICAAGPAFFHMVLDSAAKNASAVH